MITADLPVLEAIKSLEDQKDPRWTRVVDWISSNSTALAVQIIHGIPDQSDANWGSRHHTDRGFAAALSVIANIITHVDEMVATERKSVAEFEQLKRMADEASDLTS
jgi:hypothetical protein